ncbi:MAG: hypothetical protein Q8M92_02295 [Candidatus Subteraquimicrobiales bacterium]|nr:hypothetical protein [Candidatus Subteraquimicrobiales bacterium]
MLSIWCQAIGEDITAELGFPLPEIFKVIGVIVIPGKNHLSVMATLDDMMRAIGKDNAGVTRHGGTYQAEQRKSKINLSPFVLIASRRACLGMGSISHLRFPL